MKKLFLLTLTISCLSLISYAQNIKNSKHITFQGVDYFFRNSEDGLTEYTPQGQEDMNKWVDWISMIEYDDIKNDQDLVLETKNLRKIYEEQQNGVCVQENTVARIADNVNVHSIIVVFNTRDKIEVSFTNLRMKNGVGQVYVYSRRFYGNDKEQAMKWISKNGTHIEKELIDSNF